MTMSMGFRFLAPGSQSQVEPTRATDNSSAADTLARRRYDRIAPFYDVLEQLFQPRSSLWRRELWGRVDGGQVLEIGIGTGRNVAYQAAPARVFGIDISPRMLARAQRKLRCNGSVSRLLLGDVQTLPFRDRVFDVAVGTFVFTSLPDPVRGLREVRRALRPGGRLLLLERALSRCWLIERLTKRLAAVLYRACGARLDRDIVDMVRAAGFTKIKVDNLALDIVKLIEAAAPVIAAAQENRHGE
jgi:ubiquinone/menaquinone biosynthesis C-methylase UbiE